MLVGLVTTEGNELLLSSGSDRLTGSGGVGVVFFPAVEPTLGVWFVVEADDFSGSPPVLFRLVTGTEFEAFKEALKVGLVRFELGTDPFLGSIFLLILETVATETLDVGPTLGFPTLVALFAPSIELAGDCFSTFRGFSTVPLSDCTNGSSILGLAKVNQEPKTLFKKRYDHQ